jgi:hypothetical protein
MRKFPGNLAEQWPKGRQVSIKTINTKLRPLRKSLHQPKFFFINQYVVEQAPAPATYSRGRLFYLIFAGVSSCCRTSNSGVGARLAVPLRRLKPAATYKGRKIGQLAGQAGCLALLNAEARHASRQGMTKFDVTI